MIAVLTLETRPLRTRPSDIPILVNHFVREAEEKIKCARKHTIHDEAVSALCNYGWPGNVRELRHVIERLVATTMNGEITVKEVCQALPANSFAIDAQIPLMIYENDSLEAFLDRTFVSLYEQLLAQTGNHSEAARLLGPTRTALYQRLERVRKRMEASC